MENSFEATLLGMCLGSREDFDRALALGVAAEAFDLPEHRQIFAALVAIDAAGGVPSVRSLEAKHPALAATARQLRQEAPLTQNVEPYALEVQARRRLNQVNGVLLALAQRLGDRKAFDPPAAIETEVEAAFAKILDGATGGGKTGPKPIAAAIEEFFPDLERRMEERAAGKPPGITTGFAMLDHVTGGGFTPGSVNVAAARTGKGKTTLAVNFLHTAALAGYACAYFTVEMPTADILRKLLSLSGGISGTRMRNGDLTPGDMDRLMAAQRRLYPRKIWIDDSTKASLEAFEMGCRRLRRQGLDLAVIDYIQQFKPAGRFGSTYERLTEVSARLKQLALELGIAIVGLAQLNREAEKGDVQPDVWHIKDSGAIEQDSDLVLLIHQDPVKLYVGKNRNGPDKFAFPVKANLGLNLFENLNVNLEAFE